MTTVAITGTTNMTTASASSSSTTPPNVVGAGVVGSGGTTPPNNSQTNCTNALVGVVSSGTSSGLSQTSQQQQQGQQQVQQQQQQQQQQQTQTQQQSNLNTSTNSCSSKNNSSSSINNSSGNGNVAATVSVSVSGSSNNSNNGNNNNSNSSNSSNSNTSSNNINNSNNNNSNSGNTSSSNNINNNNSSSNNNNNNSSNNSNNISSNNNGNSNVNISVNNNGNNSNNNAVGMMNIKEEPNLMDTSKPQIKREDESPVGTPPNMSGVNVKKEPIQRLNSNGSANSSGIIGSTNTGSLHHGDKNANDASLVGEDSMMLGSKDDLMPDTAGGVGSINSIQSIKKEEPGPDLSPDGFSGLGGGLTSSGNNMQTSGGNNAGRMPAGSSPSDGVQSLSSNLLGNKQSGGTGMDYMQQQNHIFVFSTQLANKGAESVLNGHFPTIIAYHRAQPGTKKFLEEFFLKNPLKLSKMNRQNPTQWMNNNMMMGGNKKGNNGGGNMNSNNNNSNNPGRMVSQPKPPTSTNTGFPGDDLPGGDPELMPWEQSGNHLGLDIIANGAGSNVSNAPVTENSGLEVDNLVPGSPSLGSNRSGNNHMPITTSTTPNLQPSPTTMTTSSIGPTSPSLSGGLQPSLQGVKVPDENLTPQQRQHREEQLAKLKKMNQFLFPEQGGMGPDFVGVPPEGDQSVPGPGKMMGGGGNQNVGMLGALPGTGPMQMQLQGGMPNVGSALRGSNMMGLGPRGSLCRPMGPMGPNAMQDTMMGGVPPNNVSLNDMPGMQCGMPAGVMSNQTGPGNPPMVGGNNNMGGMMGGVPPLGHQVMMQGAPMGPGGPMNPCAVGGPMGANMMTQKHMMGGPGVAQMEWSKLQHQFYEERKVKGMDGLGMGMCPGNSPGNMSGGRQMPPGMRGNHQGGPRSQGPPPPYHQTPRSASVPIATQSPNPGSPNNPTSNLSLPSPRGGSTLNSPVGDHSTPVSSGQSVGGNQSGRQMPYKQDSPAAGSGPGGGSGNNTTSRSMNHSSNPSTPISSHLSPNASLKDLEMSNAGANCNQGKEPNLMPVPSPQQIQYLNTFEGQELTIQKQPNTSLKDGSIISPPGSAGAGGSNPGCDARLSGNTTPLTPSSLEPRFPPGAGGGGPVGNPSGNTSTGSTFPIPSSPQTPNASSSSNSSAQNTGDKNSRMGSSGPSPQGSRTPSMSGDPMQNNPNSMPSSVDSVRFPPASPGMNFSSVGGPNQGGNSSSQQSNQLKMAGFMDVSPNGKCSTSSNDTPVSGNFCGRADNMPLNPNSSCPPPAKTSHFDPISSLAQMSQQLTSSVSSSLNGQPTGVGPGPGGGGNPGAIMGGFQNHGGMGMGSDMSMGGHHVDGLMPGMDPCSMGGVMPGMGQYGMHGSGGGGLPPGLMGVPGPRSLSPKLGSGMVGFPGGAVGMPHRMIGRPPMGGSPYNGANIQVKASTPNTIQYLPARPQVGNTNPRAPPSLEFLQRFANPMSSMDGPNKVPSGQNMPFYPNCSQMGQGGPGGMGLNAHMDGGGGLGGGDGSGLMSMGGMGPGGPMMGQNMMMRGLRPPGQGGMVRMPGPSHMGGGGGHHHLPFSNGPPNGPNDPSMFPGNQMFSPGSKGSPMGGGGPNGPNGPNQPPQMPGGGPPDASQPLPPSMGGQAPGGSFKSSQFVGPSTADPNYAQQYHNFQQQLYATSTRSQMNNQPGGGGMAGPPNPNQPFFVPK